MSVMPSTSEDAGKGVRIHRVCVCVCMRQLKHT